MLTITDKALDVLKAAKAEDALYEFAALRVAVEGGGCSGFRYSLDFDTDAPQKTDAVLELGGLKVYVDAKSAPFLKGLTIDYSSGLNGKGFEFKNPNATKSCGCGQSFGC